MVSKDASKSRWYKLTKVKKLNESKLRWHKLTKVKKWNEQRLKGKRLIRINGWNYICEPRGSEFTAS